MECLKFGAVLEGEITDWGLIEHTRRFNRLALAYNKAGFCTGAGIN